MYDNEIKLINADCLKAMSTLKENSIDLIITDPPYNLANFMKNRDTNLSKMRENFFGSAGWDELETPAWEDSMERFFEESARVIKKGGAMIVFMAIIKIETIIKIAEQNDFYYKTTGIWHKTNPMPRNMHLHFVNSTETWLYFTYKKKTGVFNNDGMLYHDFIETSVTPKNERAYGKHPTQKPEKLISHFIKLLSNESDWVLDPFMGSGTSGVASKKMKRNFIGIELNEDYYKIARNRMKEEDLNET